MASSSPRQGCLDLWRPLPEDLADEWAVKPLFLYRWWDAEDQAYVSRWAGEEWSTSNAEPGSAEEVEQFRRRQISRMPILGCHGRKQAFAGGKLPSHLAAIEPHVGMTRYLFGSRPSLADFAWFGQLSELATDPTPMRIMRQEAPFTDHWVRRLDDASGVDGAWYPREQALSGMNEALLGIAGELYLPFLVANAKAFAKGMDRLEINVWGLSYALLSVQVSGQMSRFAARQICRARRRASNRAEARPGTHGLLEAPGRQIAAPSVADGAADNPFISGAGFPARPRLNPGF